MDTLGMAVVELVDILLGLVLHHQALAEATQAVVAVELGLPQDKHQGMVQQEAVMPLIQQTQVLVLVVQQTLAVAVAVVVKVMDEAVAAALVLLLFVTLFLKRKIICHILQK
jgi:hypothetical protein